MLRVLLTGRVPKSPGLIRNMERKTRKNLLLMGEPSLWMVLVFCFFFLPLAPRSFIAKDLMESSLNVPVLPNGSGRRAGSSGKSRTTIASCSFPGYPASLPTRPPDSAADVQQDIQAVLLQVGLPLLVHLPLLLIGVPFPT